MKNIILTLVLLSVLSVAPANANVLTDLGAKAKTLLGQVVHVSVVVVKKSTEVLGKFGNATLKVVDNTADGVEGLVK